MPPAEVPTTTINLGECCILIWSERWWTTAQIIMPYSQPRHYRLHRFTAAETRRERAMKKVIIQWLAPIYHRRNWCILVCSHFLFVFSRRYDKPFPSLAPARLKKLYRSLAAMQAPALAAPLLQG